MPPAAAAAAIPMVPAGQVALSLSARFGKDAGAITGGLTWRVYAAKADAKGNFKLIKEEKSPAPTLVLPAGNYIVHVGFGLATAVKPVTLARADRARDCSICRPAACGSKAASATRAFRPARFRSTSTKAASSSRATAGRSPSTS